MSSYQKLQNVLLLLLLLATICNFAVFAGKTKYINDLLPFEVQDSLLDYSNEIGDRRMIGPIRKMYRKDLDKDYVAYYELQFEDEFFIFSAGRKTGDHRLVEEGRIPRVTDILIDRATKNNNICHKFFRLSPDGVTICEDRHGEAVAATMDLVTETENANVTYLTEEVRNDLSQFEWHWAKLAKQIRKSMEWKTTKIYQINTIPKNIEITTDVLEPGDSSSIPTGTSKLSDVEISVHHEENTERRGKIGREVLCSLLQNICLDSSTKVNVSKVLKANDYMRYIEFEVNDNYDFVKKILHKKYIDLFFKLEIRGKIIVEKYFTIRLAERQRKRSYRPGTVTQYSIPHESLMPDYNQHMMYGNENCYSGCTPVAWAQIFAYYDIMANKYPSSGYNEYIYQGQHGVSGSPCNVAPNNLTYGAKQFIESLRRPLRTYCNGRSGATRSSNSIYLHGWFRSRQPYGKVIRLRSTTVVSRYVKNGYPVMNNIWWIGRQGDKKTKSGHSVVVTKVRERPRLYKRCVTTRHFWRLKTRCTWVTQYEYHWFRRLGWGGNQNNWYPASLKSAFVALRR